MKAKAQYETQAGSRSDLFGPWGYLLAVFFARATTGIQFQIMPMLAIPLGAGLGLSLSEIGVLSGLYMFPGVVVSLAAGAALQRISLSSMLTLGMGLVAVSGLLAFWAGSFTGHAVARIVGGVGAVIIAVSTLKGVYDRFDNARLPLASSITSGAQAFGIGVALLAIGSVAADSDWRLPFLVTAIMGAVGAGAFWLTVRSKAASKLKPKKAGGLSRREWVGIMIAGCVVAPYVGCFFAFLGFFPTHLAAFGWDPMAARTALGALGWAPIVMAPLGGWFVARTGRPITVATICIAAWGLGVIVTGAWQPTIGILVLLLILGPFPIGVVMSLPKKVVRADHLGTATGVFTAFIFAGNAIFTAAAGLVGDFSSGPSFPPAAATIIFCGSAFLMSLIPLWIIARRDVGQTSEN